MIFFTADHHFGHKKILEYANRPFDSVAQMDEELIKCWNEKVKPDDEVYHLGDVALCAQGKLRKILEQLQGKIYLIKGNHETAALACHRRFEWIKDYHELIVDDADFHQSQQLVVLFHYAMRVWNASHWGTFQLYGHSHGTLEDLKNSRSMDVGVDCHNFTPISYQEVKEKMLAKSWIPPFAK